MDLSLDKSSSGSPVNSDSFKRVDQPLASNEHIESKATSSPAAKSKRIAQLGFNCLSKKASSPKSISVHSITKAKANPLEFIAKSASLYRKFAKTQAKIIDSEIQTERKNKRLDKTWQEAKHAFLTKLHQLNQAKQNAKS